MTSASIIDHQKIGFVRPAFIAPGMISTVRLSTIFTIRTESVSDASTMPATAASPALSSGSDDSVYPNTNASAIDTATVARLVKPADVPMINPTVSPIEQPVRQSNVALAAIALTPPAEP